MSQKIVVGKGRSALNALDLCFDVDATGSMQPWIDRVRALITDIADTVTKSATEPDLRLALVEYRDHGSSRGKDSPTRTNGFTSDVRRFRKELSSVSCGGGADAPEAVSDGLVEALGLPWRRQAQKVVVLVGDAPPHGAGSPGDSYPKGCPCGRAPESIADSLRKAGIVLHSIAVTDDPFTLASFRDLAEIADGEFFRLTDGRRLGDALGAIVRSEGRKVADDLAVAAGYEASGGDVMRLSRMTGLSSEDVDKSIDRLRAKAAVVPVADRVDPPAETRDRPGRVRVIR
ncbi:MAG TPA: vWA domain-containing protein [Marisediminicola sp.]|jgi:Mg-chelatase subunit ChlD|nr:vWA domain-containing protein [Marisediminicola sp.]